MDWMSALSWITCKIHVHDHDKWIEHSGYTTDVIITKLLDMAQTDVSECSEVSAFASSQKWQLKNKNNSMGSDEDEDEASHLSNRTSCIHFKNLTITEISVRTMIWFSKMRKKCEKTNQCITVMFLNGHFSKPDWYIYFGASTHSITNIRWVVKPF